MTKEIEETKELRTTVRWGDASDFEKIAKAAKLKGLGVATFVRMAALDLARNLAKGQAE
jgi:uncharacterized protein (DUF1778 family)